jgi:aspartate ammonia-lyase
LRSHCIEGLAINDEACRAHLDGTTATVTALVDRLGYDVAGSVADAMRKTGRSARDIVLEQNLLDAETFDQLVSAEAVMQLGHRKEQ